MRYSHHCLLNAPIAKADSHTALARHQSVPAGLRFGSDSLSKGTYVGTLAERSRGELRIHQSCANPIA